MILKDIIYLFINYWKMIDSAKNVGFQSDMK